MIAIIIFVILPIVSCVVFILVFNRRIRNVSKQPKLYSHKILVDLEKCEVIGSSSFRTHTADEWELVLDPLKNVHDSNKKVVESSYLKYIHNGKTYFAGPIQKNEIAMRFLLMEKKITYIYYNAETPEDFFFDLSFIKE